jgi:hypothetical protein
VPCSEKASKTSGEIAEPHQIREILIINFDERYMFFIELKINFFLMQLLCQISKKLYGKSTIFNNLRTAFSHKSKPYSYPPNCGVNKSHK